MTDGPAEQERLERTLGSTDPTEVRAALTELLDRRRRGESVQVAFPGVEILARVGPDPDEELLTTFLQLLQDSGTFRPSLGWRDTIRTEVDAVLRYGGGQSAFDVAKHIGRDGIDPVGAAREAIWWLWERGVEVPAESTAAGRLLSYLLDSAPDVREAVLDAIEPWVGAPELAGVVYHVLPELTDAERAALFAEES